MVSFSLNHNDAVIKLGKANSWRFTGFYGNSKTHKHHESWSILKNLNRSLSLPWLCASDFNEIVKSYEKKGDRARPESQMKDFYEVLDECGFANLGFTGQEFTWCKRLTGGVMMWERLDRAVVNTEWISLFPGYLVTHLDTIFSNHKPLSIHMEGLPIRNQRPWRFEQVWLNEESCHTTMATAWENSSFSSNPMFVVKANAKHCQRKLKEWSKASFGNISRALVKKKQQVKEAEGEAMRSCNANRLHELKVELKELLTKEEKLWQQRSKLHWLKEGDQNTTFMVKLLRGVGKMASNA